ncbi:hypothetical protein HaLaN_30245, partial [Haematococcus lacustris]
MQTLLRRSSMATAEDEPNISTPLSHRMMLDVYQGVFTAVVERVETQPFVA